MYKFLTSAKLKTIPSLGPDIVVVGSGIAGFSAALKAAEEYNVLLITKDSMQDSATYNAQGGIAVPLNIEDIEQHLNDTLVAGAGLCDEKMVRTMLTDGIGRVQALHNEISVPFDRNGDNLARTLEGGHSKRRILHADGDATGKAIEMSMREQVVNHPHIQVLEQHFAIDLLHYDKTCYGVLCMDLHYGRILRVDALAVIVATGGCGQVYRETTNPEVATGDGMAMCFRAGAELTDMEFIQFHPTTLYLAGAPRFLISEAVRGEGAHLLTLSGQRFMPAIHQRAELAPRDVVSQAILRTMKETNTNHVLLDLRHMDNALIEKRFPTIKSICMEYGIDIMTEPIPVRPAAHYMMGGINTDNNGKTGIDRLYACGEVACTRVHGANRLASNSLLEGLVFGFRSAVAACEDIARPKGRYPLDEIKHEGRTRQIPLDIDDVLRSLRSLTWRNIGVYRSAEQLIEAEKNISFWQRYVLEENFSARAGFEVQNMLTVARVIARSAYMRQESRGAHQRWDFPNTDDQNWNRHISLTIDDFTE
jgi:L-aspartate oxidase